MKFLYREIQKRHKRFLHKINGQQFVRNFNLHSAIFYNNTKLTYKNNKYFVENKFGYSWCFDGVPQGIYCYLDGLQKRKVSIFEQYLLHEINLQDLDVVIDCGSHNGDFYLAVSDYSPIYYGFEPSPYVFETLEHNLKKSDNFPQKNINIFNEALWSTNNETLSFFIKDDIGDSSLIRPPRYTSEIKVVTRTLDDVIDRIDKNIKLIKVEAEGAEPEVLQGLSKNIKNVEYVVIDCGFERGEEQSSTITECTEFMLKNNFKFINFSSFRTICLFKNKNF